MAISTAISPDARARGLGIKTIFENRGAAGTQILPQRAAIVGQGSSNSVYPLTKLTVQSSLQVAQTYGFGSPVHMAAKQLLPDNGDGVGTIPVTIYPLEDDPSGVAAVADITPGGAQTEAASYIVRIGNIDSAQFVINAGDTVAQITAAMNTAINATLEMPMVSSDGTSLVNLACKWEGTSGNFMTVEIIGSTTAGTTFAITQPAGGLVNPSVQPALDQVGGVWETMIVNCMTTTDTANMDIYNTFGEGRWDPLVRKPCVVFTGTITQAVNDAIVIPNARTTQRTHSQLVEPGGMDLLHVIAGRQVARIISLANSVPAHDYGSQVADGLTPGADGVQWTYTERDTAVKGGSSTIEVKEGLVNVSDVVTYYHPLGDPNPAYRYVVDIVKLMNVYYVFDLAFNTQEWDGAPLVPDDQPTAEPTVKKPKMAKALAASIIDGLALQGILSEPETSKAGILAEISATNPKRLDMCIPISLSGNTNIKSFDIKWGFFFGTPSIAA